MSLSVDIHHRLGVSFGYDLANFEVLRRTDSQELEMKVVSDLSMRGFWVDRLGMDLHLDEVALSVDDLWREEEKRADDNWLSERDVVHHRYSRRRLAVEASVRPGQFERLTHEKTTEDFIVQVSLLFIYNY